MEELMGKIVVGGAVSVLEAMKAIDRGMVGVALIVDGEGLLEGVVTDGDIRRAIIRGCPVDGPVSSIMNREPVVAYEHNGESEILNLMSEKVRFVPILDGSGKLVNIASYERVYRIPVAEPVLGTRELEYVTDCVRTGWISSQGKYVRQFEQKMADRCGVEHAIATSSGTSALHLALLALGVGPDDEVIVPDMTFIASANSVMYTGARPVFVDVDPTTWVMDADLLLDRITDRTKALMPVHLFGVPAPMDSIMEVARNRGLLVIEDAAEAHGAEINGRPAGSIGDVGCFSFFGNKIVTTGEGGMVTTNDSRLAERVRLLRDHGMSKEVRYLHEELGFNYRLTNLQAAVGVAQMEKLDRILERKREIAGVYEKNLGADDRIVLPPNPMWGTPVYWMFAVLLGDDCGVGAPETMEMMAGKNIEARPFFVPLDKQPIYKDISSGHYPVAERLYESGICLPSSANLGDADVKRICDCLLSSLA